MSNAEHSTRDLLIALGALLFVLAFTIPASPWEFDEILFLQGIHHYDPVAHHPPPPGYPLFMMVGHAVRAIAGSGFAALIGINLAASAIGFLFLALAFRNISGDARAGIAGALLFYLSPVMLIHATTGMSDPGALGLFAVALYFSTKVMDPASGVLDAVLFGVFAALTVGWRPQFAIAVLPLLLVAVALTSSWRGRAATVGAFTLVCLMWLAPLAAATGGLDSLIRYETSQAAYLGEHDADVSRSGYTASGIATRFIAHPWGTKLASLPLLALAAAGIAALIRRRNRRVLPLAIATAAYLGFALRFMDPADGTRYSLPATLGVAFFAGVGAWAAHRRFRISAYVLAAMFGAGSIIYVSSLIAQRTVTAAPPLQAARYARAAFPASSVALYELPLWPHAQYFLGDRGPMRVNDGLAAYFDRADVPLFIYADGASSAPGAKVFRWWGSDAYSKLTRNHYRVVSIIPVPPERRFRVVSGIFAPEREIDGDEWRWLAPSAALQLPHGPARTLSLRVGLPVIYPSEVNTLTITVGSQSRTVELTRGRRVEVDVAVPAGAPVVSFTAGRSFVPAEVPGSLNRDPRRLAVKLYDVHASTLAGAAPQSASR